ncbi:MAG: hypothetical protein GY952_07810 [Rhodobacteraceae bacterium]|nr:hypothetical protein [Paracoccaceae bacterium]
MMAMLHHAFTDNQAATQWLSEWGERLGEQKIAGLRLRSGMVVISESLHRQRYKFLWELLFDRHPKGDYYNGRWESAGVNKTEVPSDEILLDMFKEKPTALILDEFQTWYDGLTNSKQSPWRNWAFNFIQILSEIAKKHPDLLVQVVSVGAQRRHRCLSTNPAHQSRDCRFQRPVRQTGSFAPAAAPSV